MMKNKDLFRIFVILLFLFIGPKGVLFARGAGNNPVNNPIKNLVVFNPKEQTKNPSPFSRQLLAALRDLKHPASLADEKQLKIFFALPKESRRLLILTGAGMLSPRLRHAVDQYLEQGGDLLVVGNPSEGLTQGNPLGGITGRYFTYEAREGDRAIPLLNPPAQLTLSGLPGPLTAATAFPQAKAASAESPSLNFGRWINWLPMQSGEVPLLGSLASTWISGKKSQPDQVSVFSHLGISGQFSNLKMLEKLLDPILSYHEAGIALLNAGPSAFHFSPEDEKSWGGRMLNRNAAPQQVSVEYQLKKTGAGKIASGGRILDLPPGQAVDWKEAITPKPVDEGDYLLQMDVRGHDGKLVDRQFSRFTVTKLKPVPSLQAVTIKNGHFMLNGHPWFFRGVHYWLPQVVGQPDAKMWLEYLMPAFYNPDQVERDLRAMVAGGMNSVVVSYRDIQEASGLKDFLARCERQGLRAMVFIENAHPLKFDLAKLRAMILAAELGKQPALFAMDLAWEPHLGYEKDRQVLNAAWGKWIVSQYGTVATAESIWKFSIPGDSGSVQGPTDDELMEDGPWKVMVAAYRRFLDDQISLGYGEVTRTVKALCPNVLLGARTGYGGTGHFTEIDRRVPFDLVSGADHLDYISPEAYGLQGDWSGFQDGFLITEAARYAGRYNKPVVWMEYGKSALTVGSATWSPQQLNLKVQADYYQNMARLIKETQADGAFAWWWVGGYRTVERSDFGLMDITGIPRPAFRILANTGQPSGIAWKPDTWISIDRDLHPRGLSMLIRSNREKFLQLLGEGKRVGFSSPSDKLTTENFPLVGVGNAGYHGAGPIKGLNGEIYSVEVTAPAQSSPVAQNTGVPFKIRLHVLNTGRVAWSSDPGSGGCVAVELVAHGKTIALKPVSKDIPGGGDEREEFTLREKLPPGPYILTLTSKRTGRFGLPVTFEVGL